MSIKVSFSTIGIHNHNFCQSMPSLGCHIVDILNGYNRAEVANKTLKIMTW